MMRLKTIGALLCMAACGAFAETIDLQNADSAAAATTSFNSGSGWAGGAAPTGGNAYRVALGATSGMYLPTAAATFAGDELIIGSDSAAGYLGGSATEAVVSWSVPLLTLKKGVWQMPKTGNLTGFSKIVVTSTAEDPFVIQLGSNAETQFKDLSFYGERDAVLILRKDGSTLSKVSLNNRYVFDNFKGKLILDGICFSSATSGAIQRMFSADQSDDSFLPDRITLMNNSGFGQYGYNNHTWTSSRIGVTIDSTGASFARPDHDSPQVFFPVVGGPLTIESGDFAWEFFGRIGVTSMDLTAVDRSNKRVLLATDHTNATDAVTVKGCWYNANWPYSGYATLYVAGGTFEKTVAVTVSGYPESSKTQHPSGLYGRGWLFVAAEPSSHLKVTLQEGGVVAPNPAGASMALIPSLASRTGSDTATAITLKDFTYEAGHIELDFDAANNAMDSVTLAGTVTGVSEEHPLQFRTPAALPSASFTGTYPILRVPTSVMTLTKAMADISRILLDDESIVLDTSLETVEGVQVLSLRKKTAEVVTLAKGDTAFGEVTAFNGNPDGNWSDGEAPHAGPYVVALGLADGLYLPTVASVFAGTMLTIGTESAAGYLAADAGADWTIAKLVLNNGRWDIAKPCTLANLPKVIVESTAANPFEIRVGANDFRLSADNSVYGEEDAVLSFARLSGTSAFEILGNTSAFKDNYKGRLILDGVCLATLSSSNFNAMFANAEEFAADRIILKNGGGLKQYGGGVAQKTFQNAKVGITVDSTGGTLEQPYEAFPLWYVPFVGGPLDCVSAKFCARLGVSDLLLEAKVNKSRAAIFSADSTIAVDAVSVKGDYFSGNPPNSGTGKLFVGGGTYEKSVPLEVGGATQSSVYGQGYVYLPAESSANFQITLLPGGHICPNVAASGEAGQVGTATESITLKDLSNAGGDIVLKYDAANDSIDSVELTGAVTGISAETPLKLTGENIPVAAFTGDYPVLKVSPSVMTLTKDMVDLSGIKFDDPASQIDCDVKSEDGNWILFVRQKRQGAIKLIQGDGECAETTAFNGHGERWSDGQVPHQGVYVVALGTNDVTQSLFTPSLATATFLGSKLSIGDEEDGAGRMDAMFKTDCTLESFDLVDGLLNVGVSGVRFSNPVSVLSTTEKPFVITGASNASLAFAVKGDETAQFVVRGPETGMFEYSAGFSWGGNGTKDYAGRIVLDGNVRMVIGTLAYANTAFVPDAIRLRNDAALATTAAWPSLAATKMGVTVEETGGRFLSTYVTQNTVMSLALRGGPFTFDYKSGNTDCALKYTGSASLAAWNVKGGSINVGSGATMSNETYAVTGGALTFNEGVTFANVEAVPAVVTNGTLRIGSAAASALKVDLRADGTLAAENDGAACQTLAMEDLKLGGGASLRLDVDPQSGVCDAIVASGSGCVYSATRANKLNIVVNPLQASGEVRNFTLLTLPRSAGVIDRKSIAVSFAASSDLDGLGVIVSEQGGNQFVRLTDEKPGFSVLVR